MSKQLVGLLPSSSAETAGDIHNGFRQAIQIKAIELGIIPIPAKDISGPVLRSLL